MLSLSKNLLHFSTDSNRSFAYNYQHTVKHMAYHLKGSREEPEMSHLQICGHRRFFQSTVRTSPVFPWDSLSSTASSGGLSRFFPRNISRMETMGCKQAPHAVNSGTEILWHLQFFPWTLHLTYPIWGTGWVNIKVAWKAVQFSSVRFLTCTFRASCYRTRLSWGHTPVISWVVCLGQMLSS